jgi:hypothetical protein
MPSASQVRTVRIAPAIWAGSIFLSRIMGLVHKQVIGRTQVQVDKRIFTSSALRCLIS